MKNKNDENYVYYLVGQNIKKQRKLKNLTQAKLAELSLYSESFIANIESKKYHQTFSLGTIWTLANTLNIDIKEFFNELDNEK